MEVNFANSISDTRINEVYLEHINNSMTVLDNQVAEGLTQ